MIYLTLEQTLLAYPEAVKEYPFGPDAAVFKVAGKMFALVAWQQDPLSITLKCLPDEAYALRATYSAIRPGYHMNKEHWNTITIDGTVPEDLLWKMIDDSYQLVVSKLPKATRQRLQTT